jgi:hypothetical protein
MKRGLRRLKRRRSINHFGLRSGDQLIRRDGRFDKIPRAKGLATRATGQSVVLQKGGFDRTAFRGINPRFRRVLTSSHGNSSFRQAYQSTRHTIATPDDVGLYRAVVRVQENAMIRIKLEYDEEKRDFKLIGIDYDTLAEGDALYDLNLHQLFDDGGTEIVIPSNTFVAHA